MDVRPSERGVCTRVVDVCGWEHVCELSWHARASGGFHLWSPSRASSCHVPVDDLGWPSRPLPPRPALH